ncbi:ribonuclease HII [Alkalibaculum sp. M08DMB]|uniref:Ribonuclease HII n=1 Tax=Alkalibaculum sporogenes TaxID=2655001 RepID=A0A6A7KA58_9FIRM|nr:ribonuclease HII [Alkalibaculum sporogenes]MPW26067.1 ribonuclease HII [Alkalibaculum sporogenes]
MEISQLSISQIKQEINKIVISEYPEFINRLDLDDRGGVQQLKDSLISKYNKYTKEKQRIQQLKSYESSLYNRGYKLVAGMDEVGRGPLAGPVVSCAIVLPESSNILYVNDSKKLSSSKREELYYAIKEDALSIGIGIIEKDIIDDINIFQGTKQSMVDAVDNLRLLPEIVLIDAMHIEALQIPQKSILKGDEKCYSIAAASIIAKVTRDRIMDSYHDAYPEYNFKSNKGYGTNEHIEAIKKYGICPIHRLSFLNNILGTFKEVELNL